MDCVCEFIIANIDATNNLCKFIEQIDDEYFPMNMSDYIIDFLKHNMMHYITNIRIIVNEKKHIILFTSKNHDCEIIEYYNIVQNKYYWIITLFKKM